jgi:hypothetical protein
MVDAVSSFSALSYLNQIKGVSKPPVVSSNAPEPEEGDSLSNNPASSGTGNGSPQSSNPFQISSEVLSLLQGISSDAGKGSLISEIVGSAGSADAFSGVYDTFLQSASSTEPFQQALNALQQRRANTATRFNTLDNVLSGYHAGFNAYNKVLQQNAQATLDASKKPIIA